MSDAKVERYHFTVHECRKGHQCNAPEPYPEGDWVKYTDYAALAERMNQAECNHELVELYWQREQAAIKQRDQLAADLAEAREQAESENRQACLYAQVNHKLLVEKRERKADLERARAEIERLKKAVKIRDVAAPICRAYIEKSADADWAEVVGRIKASNERLNAAINDIGNFAKAHHLEQERDNHLWLHALIVDIPAMVEAALKEMP